MSRAYATAAPARARRRSFWLLVVACLALLIGGCSEQAVSPAPPAPPAPPSPSPGVSPIERGAELYGMGCASCHGQQGDGGRQGPSLIGVGGASADFQLSTGRMPMPPELDRPVPGPPFYAEEDIAALVEYVAALGPGPEVPTLGPGDLVEGRDLFLATCASCHGSTGTGTAMVEGHVAPSVVDTDPVQVAEAIRVGPGMMPVFPEGALSDEEVESIVTYVASLPDHDARGGVALGGLGTVPEGLVAWFVGIGFLLIVARLLGKRADQ